ncbi:cyclin-L2-like [Anopheles stephensi]|uniref:Cyclin-like domain-containing protein n=1 Tax=Anopheles stephensi TaxID=30069 RepID=A0A182Y3P0_ANOST|nr:cyclin-L2-like [Anopheles stephensi]
MSVSKTITETVTNSKTASAVIGAQAPPAASATMPVQRPYGKIVLTLENCLLPEVKLDQTPSQNDGLDRETETDLRILGCELIQTAGILLKLPQVAMATGQVLFQRFFYSKSFVRHSMEATAMSCICLASKIEEAPRRIRDVINVFHHIKQVRSQKPMIPMILDQHYINLKSQVIKAERRVLKELGFCVHVKHPHKLIVMYLKYLELEKHQNMMQMAWNFMNDSFRTDVFVRYQPETIACACIYLTARKHNIPLPNSPPWFVIFRVSEDDMLDVCYRIMALYKRGKPNAEQLEEAVEALKKKYQEQRKKDRPEASAVAAPTVITVDRNNGSHNAWGGFIQRAMPLPLNSSGNTGTTNSGGSNTAAAAIGGVANSGSNANSGTTGLNNNEPDAAAGSLADGKKSRSRSKSLSKSSRSKSRSRSGSRSVSRSRSRGSRSRSRTSHSRSRSKTRTSRSRSRSIASRSRSRSRSPHSPHYSTEKGGSRRTSKKSRHRSRTPVKVSSSAKKKSSRHYSSRSPSPDSPQKYKKSSSDKKYDRRSGREDRNNDNRYTNGSDRDRDRSKGMSNSMDHSRSNRDRDNRDRMRSDSGKVGSGGGYDRDDYRRSEKDYRGNGKHDKYGSSRHSDSSSRHRSSKHERERSRDRDRDRRR